MSGLNRGRVIIDVAIICKACGGIATWYADQTRPTLCDSCAIAETEAEIAADDRRVARAERRDKEEEEERTKHIFDRWGGVFRRLGEGPK